MRIHTILISATTIALIGCTPKQEIEVTNNSNNNFSIYTTGSESSTVIHPNESIDIPVIKGRRLFDSFLFREKKFMLGSVLLLDHTRYEFPVEYHQLLLNWQAKSWLAQHQSEKIAKIVINESGNPSMTIGGNQHQMKPSVEK